jgi:hypothetical protein
MNMKHAASGTQDCAGSVYSRSVLWRLSKEVGVVRVCVVHRNGVVRVCAVNRNGVVRVCLCGKQEWRGACLSVRETGMAVLSLSHTVYRTYSVLYIQCTVHTLYCTYSEPYIQCTVHTVCRDTLLYALLLEAFPM